MSDEFIEYEHSVQNERIRLFCFHYAGGNASFYSDWYKYLSSDIGVYPVQLPGRGKRWGAEMYTSVEEASEIIASQIQSYSDVPLIFTGHSMGGLIAYQTALMLQDNYGISLKQLFITGSYPEMGVDNISDAYKLTDSEFCERLKSYGGIDERVFKIKQFYTFFLPVIKNDFLMAEEENGKLYAFHKISEKLRTKNGKQAKLEDLAVGDELTVLSDGRVLLSDPYQIENVYKIYTEGE